MIINNVVEHKKNILLTIGVLENHFEPKSWKKFEIEEYHSIKDFNQNPSSSVFDILILILTLNSEFTIKLFERQSRSDCERAGQEEIELKATNEIICSIPIPNISAV